MNKWLLGVAMLLSSLFSYAQSPQAMNFQAVARNAGGNPISDKEVGIKIEIVQGAHPVQPFMEKRTIQRQPRMG